MASSSSNASPPPLTGITELTERIIIFLKERQVKYELLEHRPVFTSAEAAEVRGTNPSQGAKALVVKGADQYQMLVLPGDRRADNAAVRRLVGSKKLRFAGREELFDLTGCYPGSVPPFGNLFGLMVWLDQTLAEEPQVAFNAGSHSVSLKMAASDLVTVTRATVASFSIPS